MTPEPIVITPTIPGLRPYPPLIFAWQKWPMKLLNINPMDGKHINLIIAIYYQHYGKSVLRRYEIGVPPHRLKVLYYDKNGLTPKSIEKFYRLAHLTFSRIAADDPDIQAFAPEVGQE